MPTFFRLLVICERKRAARFVEQKHPVVPPDIGFDLLAMGAGKRQQRVVVGIMQPRSAMIERRVAAEGGGVLGPGAPADPAARFQQRHRTSGTTQFDRGGQPSHAGPDDGDIDRTRWPAPAAASFHRDFGRLIGRLGRQGDGSAGGGSRALLRPRLPVAAARPGCHGPRWCLCSAKRGQARWRRTGWPEWRWCV